MHRSPGTLGFVSEVARSVPVAVVRLYPHFFKAERRHAVDRHNWPGSHLNQALPMLLESKLSKGP